MQHFDRKIKLGIGRPGSEIINYQVDNINKQSQPNFQYVNLRNAIHILYSIIKNMF